MRIINSLIVLCLGLSPACSFAQAAAPPATSPAKSDVDELLDLMKRRLDVMHDVAKWKWKTKSPIEDPKREAALLDDVAKRGEALKLDPKITRAFFQAQIEAAKLVQQADFRRWEKADRGPEGEAPDLAGVLRPRIDGLNRDLLRALSRTSPQLPADAKTREKIRRRAEQRLTGDGLDAKVRTTALRSLLGESE